MKTTHLSLAVTLAGAVGLVACQHEQAASNANSIPTSQAQPQSGVTSMQGSTYNPRIDQGPYAGNDATLAEQLATARCDHEEHCEHVGTGQAFTSLDECVSQVRARMKTELERYGCRGLSSSGVNECMSTINGESCQQSANDLSHLQECSSRSVCATSP